MLEFFLVWWPSFTLGILHSLQPCEDKAIFTFYAFGVSRGWKEILKLLNLYGLGLLTANVCIGLLFSVIGGTILTYLPEIPLVILGGVATIISGIYMLVLIRKHEYDPHSRQKQEIGTVLTRKTNSAYSLGILAGVPPCIMEMAIYVQATMYAANYGILTGVFAVVIFSLGTWMGLYPLAVLGYVGARAKQWIQTPWRIEKLSAWILIILGVIYILLASFGINLFTPLV